MRVICFHNLLRPDDRRGRSTHSARRQDICLARGSGLRQQRVGNPIRKQDAAFAPREPGCVRWRVSLADRKKSRGAASLCAADNDNICFANRAVPRCRVRRPAGPSSSPGFGRVDPAFKQCGRDPIAAPGTPPDIIGRTASPLPSGSDGSGRQLAAIEEAANEPFCVVRGRAAGRRAGRGARPVRFAAPAAELRDKPARLRQPAAAADPAELSQRLVADAARIDRTEPIGGEPRADRGDAPAERGKSGAGPKTTAPSPLPAPGASPPAPFQLR